MKPTKNENFSQLRVMIVEDEGIIAAGLECCVKDLGHVVVGTAYTGEEAVLTAKQEKPELILMDINLPDMTGITAMKLIAEQARIPCIFLTAYSDRSLIVEANNIDCTYGYLIKPIDISELSAAIEVAMSRHGERIALEQEVSSAKKALENRKIIERAKGMLMDNFNMKESEAMAYLQKKSNESNKKISVVARDIFEFFTK